MRAAPSLVGNGARTALHGEKPCERAFCPPYNAVPSSPRQRIRPDLELHHLRQRALAALDVERRALAVGRPDAAALPARVRIVDASVHALGVEAEIGRASW